MDKKTIYVILAIAALAFVYWKFFHKKRGPMAVAAGGTPAVKKKGGGGWRHRFSKLGKIGLGAALKVGDVYSGGMASKVAG